MPKIHTINFLKQENWYPQLLNKKNWKTWRTEGSKELSQRLTEKARQIIEEDVPPLISEAEEKELNKIIAAREKQLDAK